MHCIYSDVCEGVEVCQCIVYIVMCVRVWKCVPMQCIYSDVCEGEEVCANALYI